jgi:hypothetical protein
MTLHFRNLDFDTTQPMDCWPAEAIETIIDRGSLSDWRPLPVRPTAEARPAGRSW